MWKDCTTTDTVDRQDHGRSKEAQQVVSSKETTIVAFRVFVSNVHSELSESDLKAVFAAFGDVVKCQMARNLAGIHETGHHRLE